MLPWSVSVKKNAPCLSPHTGTSFYKQICKHKHLHKERNIFPHTNTSKTKQVCEDTPWQLGYLFLSMKVFDKYLVLLVFKNEKKKYLDILTKPSHKPQVVLLTIITASPAK